MVFDVFLIASTGEYNIYKKRVRDIPQLCKRKKNEQCLLHIWWNNN